MVKHDPVRLPQNVVQDRKQTEAPTPAGHVVIAYGLPDPPGRPMHLPQGSARLDIVGYDRHVDHNGNDDGRKYPQTNHGQRNLFGSCSQTQRQLL